MRNRGMNKLMFLASILLLTSCSFGYGPVQDYSRFVSARLLGDGKTILFTYHCYAYRPATGWRAFPDGGIPKYVKDINLIGVYDLSNRKVRLLRRENNTEWQPGSGLCTINAVNGRTVLLSQGGQLRGPFRLGVRYLLLDLVGESVKALDLNGDMAKFGMDPGEIYLIDPDGSLLFVALPLALAKDARKNIDQTEIWLRTPGDSYLKVAGASIYETVRNREVVYWVREARQFHAFSLDTRKTREAAEFRPSGYVDVTAGVIVSANGKGLEYGVKVDGTWRYRPVRLSPEILR